ncbi:MAG: SpoIIE family protein phosphatase [Candidatus Eisenbacteria bacterium]
MTALFAWLLFFGALLLGYRLRVRTPEETARRMMFAFVLAFLGRFVGFLAKGVDAEATVPLIGLRGVVVISAAIETAALVFAAAIVTLSILDLSGKRLRKIRFGLLGLGLAIMFTSPLHGAEWSSFVFFILFALSSRWTRDVHGFARLGAALPAFLFAITAAVSRDWPEAFAGPFLRNTGTFRAPATLLLAIHGLAAAPRLVFGFRLEVRRIGRRLLVSHLLGILVPTILAVSFVFLLALVSIAESRAASAKRLINERGTAIRTGLERALIASGAARDGVPSDPAAAGATMLALFDEPPGGSALILSRVGGEGTAELLSLTLSGGAGAERERDPVPGDPEAWVLPTATWLARPPSTEDPILFAEGKVLLGVRASAPLGDGSHLRADFFREIPLGRLVEAERILGAPARINPLVRVMTDGNGVTIGPIDTETRDRALADRERWEEAGLEAESEELGAGRWMPGAALILLASFDDEEGAWSERLALVTSRAAPRDIWTGVSSWERNRLSLAGLIALLFIALLFLLVVSGVLGTVLTMNRAIAVALGLLTRGTRRLRDGDFDHRIEVPGEDELAQLGDEFNRMAEGLEEGRRLAIEKERVEQELAIAKEIQQKLLPESPPVVPGLELAGISIPAREVGGDYFDFLLLDTGILAVVIADVSGKGVPAALLMSSLRASLHAGLSADLEPAATAVRLNGFVYASTKSENFITGFLGVVNAESGEVRFANAGHESPLLLRNGGGVEAVEGGGLMLGAFAEAPYDEIRFRLETGDLMLLYTDGVTEAMDRSGAFYGEDRLRGTLAGSAGSAASEVLRDLVEDVRRFTAGAEPSDDITLVAIRRVGV